MKTNKKILAKRYQQRMLKRYPNLQRLASRIAKRVHIKGPTKRAMITGSITITQIEEAEQILLHLNKWLNHFFYGRRVNTPNYIQILETIDNHRLMIPIVLMCADKQLYYEQVFFK